MFPTYGCIYLVIMRISFSLFQIQTQSSILLMQYRNKVRDKYSDFIFVLKCWVWLFFCFVFVCFLVSFLESCRISLIYLCFCFLTNPCIPWDSEEVRGPLRKCWDCFYKPTWRKAAMFSCESCFPFHRMLYFYLSLNSIPHKLTCKREMWFFWLQQWDLNATLSWKPGSSTGHPLPTSETFYSGLNVENSRVCVENFMDPRADHGTPPTTTPLHLHPVHKRTEGYSVTWMFDKLKKKNMVDPKLTSTLKKDST